MLRCIGDIGRNNYPAFGLNVNLGNLRRDVVECPDYVPGAGKVYFAERVSIMGCVGPHSARSMRQRQD
jgi:hypothetical protein